jgi:hypothetical protein
MSSYYMDNIFLNVVNLEDIYFINSYQVILLILNM